MIKDFKKKSNIIKNDILIIGTGRWAKVLLSELISNFPNIGKIYIFGKHLNSIKSFSLKKNFKNIFFIKKLNKVFLKKVNFCLIANQNKKHLFFAKKLIENKVNILVEKPLVFKDYDKIQKLDVQAKKNKVKIYLSLPFSYAFYLIYTYEKFLKNEKILELKLSWFDKKKIKERNFSKNQVSFVKDNFYHLFSILRIFKLHSKIKSIKFNQRKNLNSNDLIFTSGNSKIYFFTRRFSKQRVRKLNIITKNNQNILVNFCKTDNPSVHINNTKIVIPKYTKDKMLKYQLYFFLKKTDSILNEFKYLSKLFKIVKV